MSDTYNDQNASYQQEGQPTDETGDVHAQIVKLRADLAELANTVTAIAAEKAVSYGSKVANDAVEASQNAVEGVRSDYASLEQTVADRIRARPIQAVGFALGIGYLYAMMKRR